MCAHRSWVRRIFSFSVSYVIFDIYQFLKMFSSHELYKNVRNIFTMIPKNGLIIPTLIGFPLTTPTWMRSFYNIPRRYNEWTRVLLKEMLELSVIVYCCTFFRLSNFTDYNNISITTPYHNNVVLLTPYRNIVYISSEHDDKIGSEPSQTWPFSGSCHVWTPAWVEHVDVNLNYVNTWT